MTTASRFHQFRQAIECSPASVIITDRAGRIEYINPKFTELTGYTLAEVVGKSPRILKSGKTPPEVYEELWLAITGGHEWRGEFVNRKKNGELYIEQASISPVTDPQGAITHFVAVKQDITVRRQTEEKLAKAHAFLQLVIDTVPEPIMAIGADYRIRIMNSTLQQQLPAGAARESLPFCYQVSHHRETPCDGDEHPCPLREVATRKETVRVEHIHYNAAGKPRYIEIIAAPLPSEDGTFAGIIESSRDITERRQAEELIRYRAEYDLLTGIPNRQLFQDRFRQALALAKREGQLLGLLFLDLDGFKTVNDTLGHQAGDQLLKEVAGRLLSALRQSDTLARMGGDEFAIVLGHMESDESHAEKALRAKITAALAPPFRIAGQNCRVGASMGLAFFPTDGDNPDILLAVADERMYRDKEGRKTKPQAREEGDAAELPAMARGEADGK